MACSRWLATLAMDAIVAKALECIAVLEAKPDIGGWTTSKVTDMSSVSHKDVDKSSYSFPVGELFPALRDEGPTDTHMSSCAFS